jgi:hypothetical protein
VPEFRDVVVTLEDHRARMNIDPVKTPLQRVVEIIVGASGKYTPRLLMHLEDRASYPALKSALEKLKGVRYVREPNDKGLLLIDLRREERTTLQQIYEAAEQARLKVEDAPKSLSAQGTSGRTGGTSLRTASSLSGGT